jgi:dipeptidyl aminopeptidase/acylaminoacyl peptidase
MHPCTRLALILSLGAGPAHALDPEPFVRNDVFGDIRISPTGEYLAATIPLDDRVGLAILRTSDRSVTGKVSLGPNTAIDGFWWVNDERVVLGVAQQFGSLDEPLPTGELVGVNANGGRDELLVGQRATGAPIGSRISAKKGDRVAARMVDTLPDDERWAIITTEPFTDDPFRKLERMDVYTGRRVTIGRAPILHAWFATDNAGTVRFAWGEGTDLVSKLFHRPDDEAEWTLVSDQSRAGVIETPVGFSSDNRLAYLRVQRVEGPDVIVEFDPTSGTRRTVLEDDNTSPAQILYRGATQTPIGAVFMDGARRVEFIDPKSPEARLQRSLEAAFPGQAVQINSTTKDGGIALVEVRSDRNPGDFYLFDTVNKKADFLLARRTWLDPAAMAEMRPVTWKARDGLALHGYLTLPPGRGEKHLPLIVLPHGGPFGIFDAWGFDYEAQLFAAAGYAVLQPNFRGSGNHGRAFQQAGAGQWGKTMQDDVTDATRWAIAAGIADPKRICIHGASYGAYAALMGVAREPDLYRCASGYVGVYDLPLMHTRGDIRGSRWGETYLREWVGEPDALAAVSPVNLADRIKAPVFLAGGGEDRRTPIVHTERMEKALKNAGVPVESLTYPTEGHGFYEPAHRKEYYGKLLGFFAQHLGAGGAETSTAGAATAER